MKHSGGTLGSGEGTKGNCTSSPPCRAEGSGCGSGSPARAGVGAGVGIGAGTGAGIFTNFTRDYGIYFQTDRMLLVIFFFMLRSETHQKAVMFYCSQRKCLFQLPLRQSLKLNRLNFNFRLVFHSIFGFGQIRSKLFSTIKSAWTVKGILNAVGFR